MPKGKKSAVLVACSYYNSPSRMYGCENDLQTIKVLLESKFSFASANSNISILIEQESRNSTNQPTKANIKKELENMIQNAGKGDVLFFYFSGMGKLVGDNKIPAICSSDRENLTANYFRAIVSSLPEDVTFTFVCESSYSGNFLDPEGTEKSILISACEKKEKADRKTEIIDGISKEYGLFTEAFKQAVNANPVNSLSHVNLVKKITEYLETQTPCLRCIQEMKTKYFLDYLN